MMYGKDAIDSETVFPCESDCNDDISSSPLVSVIIPVYNVEKYFQRCMDSIIGQTYRNLEIIVVDDGSTDASSRLCDEYAKKDSRVVLVRQKNFGLSHARNTALDIMRGSVVAFVDSDDSIGLQMIERTVETMLNDDLDAVLFEAQLVNEREEIIGERFHVFDDYTVVSIQDVIDLIITDKIGSQVWKGVYRSRCWNNVRFPTGRLYEDIATTFKAYANMSRPVGFLPERLYNYRLNTQGISLSKGKDAIRAYHIFLGFCEQLTYASDHCGKQTVKICFANAYRSANNVMMLYKPKSDEYRLACDFLRKNRKYKLFNANLTGKQKAKLAFLSVFPWMTEPVKWFKRRK